jgi:predicted Ser/Thr protein kinase
VQHVSVWTKKERIRNRVTGEYEEPDEKMMKEVERLLDVKGEAHEMRKQMISAIAAWAIDHPGQKVDPSVVFPNNLKRMRDTIFGERRPAVAQRARDLEVVVRDEGTGLDALRKRNAEATIERLIARYAYCRNCAADAASVLVRRRFQDLAV